MKNKKIITFGLLLILMLSTVFGAPIVESLATSNIQTEEADLLATFNESVNGTIFVSTSITMTPIHQQDFTGTKSTLLALRSTGLTGGTQYFWQVNASNDNGDVSSVVANFTTTEYTLQGSERTFIGLFVFIVMTFIMIGALILFMQKQLQDTGKVDVMSVVIFFAIGVMAVAVLSGIVTGMLSA